jgi:hypothetical protein
VLAPPFPHALATLAPPPPRPSRLTMPLPYPKIVLCGLAAGGSAGNSAPPPPAPRPLTGPVLAGLLVGGVGLALPGLLLFAEGACGTQGMVDTFVELVFCGREDVGGGRVGKGLL